MAEYETLDDDALQELLAQASSYNERSTIRQVIRKRKKERGQTVSKADSKGRSSYNRFAGSTATKTASNPGGKSFELPTSARSQNSSAPALRPVKKEEKEVPPTRKHRSPSPPPVQPSPEPNPQEEEEEEEEDSPVPPEEQSVSPQSDEDVLPEQVDGPPVTEEPAEDEPTHWDQDQDQDQTDDGRAQEEQAPEEEEAPEEKVSEATDGEEEVDQSQAAEEVESSPSYVETEDVSDGPQDLQHYLVVYVNKELSLDPPLPSRGKMLYDTCSDPTVLCKLINKSVPGTVDMRALSKVRGTAAQIREAIEENMTLVVESGRAIGCPIQDETAEKIIQKDPNTITNFLVDLVRARVVHLPGMDDEPSSTFSDWTYLFEKLKISVGSISSQSEGTKKEVGSERSWRDSEPSDGPSLTYEQRAAKRKAEREQKQKEKDAQGSSVGLTYEERAQQRKADRERRRREREALAK